MPLSSNSWLGSTFCQELRLKITLGHGSIQCRIFLADSPGRFHDGNEFKLAFLLAFLQAFLQTFLQTFLHGFFFDVGDVAFEGGCVVHLVLLLDLAQAFRFHGAVGVDEVFDEQALVVGELVVAEFCCTTHGFDEGFWR